MRLNTYRMYLKANTDGVGIMIRAESASIYENELLQFQIAGQTVCQIFCDRLERVYEEKDLFNEDGSGALQAETLHW